MERKSGGGNNIQIIEIRKIKSHFGSDGDYLNFRHELISKAIHPWIKDFYQHRRDIVEIPDGIWALIACELVEGAITTNTLISFEELDFGLFPATTTPFEGITSFNEWVVNFKPDSWGDWLMVPKLYLMHLRTRQNLPALAATPDPWIDAVLHESRGVLMWSNQFSDICRVIEGIDNTKIAKIRRICSLSNPEWQDTLRSIHYSPTNQTLLDIFEERTLGIEYMRHVGYRDYIFATWLSNHFHQAIRMAV